VARLSVQSPLRQVSPETNTREIVPSSSIQLRRSSHVLIPSRAEISHHYCAEFNDDQDDLNLTSFRACTFRSYRLCSFTRSIKHFTQNGQVTSKSIPSEGTTPMSNPRFLLLYNVRLRPPSSFDRPRQTKAFLPKATHYTALARLQHLSSSNPT